MSRVYRERLIDEVKRFPVLYDTRHEHHRDMDVRERCWDEIAARLGGTSDVLKREWKILRDSLRQAQKKSRQRSTTKAGLPVKTWRFQQRMSFLLPHMTRRPRASFEHMKVEEEPPAPDEAGDDSGAGADDWEPNGRAARRARGAEGGADADAAGLPGGPDALELFFASVCASARRLPPPAQRLLKRSVLAALLRAEADAESPAPVALPARPGGPPGAAATGDARSSKPEAYDDEF